jgi:hypothetical protein
MMVLGKEKSMERKDIIALVFGVVLVAVTAIICTTYYNLQRDSAMKSNIESAIVKGIDPIAVRCAYGSSDTLCIVYASTHNKEIPNSKK